MDGVINLYQRGQQLASMDLPLLDFLKLAGDSNDEDILIEAVAGFIPSVEDAEIEDIDIALNYFTLAYQYLHEELAKWVDCTERVVNPIAVDKTGGVIYAISIESYNF